MKLIPGGASFQGSVCWSGDVRIDGRLSGGEAVGEGRLEIGPEAEVRARVEVAELRVEGRLEGDAVASRRIELGAGAHVVGDLRAPVVVLADGARLEGRLEITPQGARGPAETPQEAVSAPLSP